MEPLPDFSISVEYSFWLRLFVRQHDEPTGQATDMLEADSWIEDAVQVVQQGLAEYADEIRLQQAEVRDGRFPFPRRV